MFKTKSLSVHARTSHKQSTEGIDSIQYKTHRKNESESSTKN